VAYLRREQASVFGLEAMFIGVSIHVKDDICMRKQFMNLSTREIDLVELEAHGERSGQVCLF
jgi:hypothetical protein